MGFGFVSAYDSRRLPVVAHQHRKRLRVVGFQRQRGFDLALEPAGKPQLAEDAGLLRLVPQRVGQAQVVSRILGIGRQRLLRQRHGRGSVAPGLTDLRQQPQGIRVLRISLIALLEDGAGALEMAVANQRLGCRLGSKRRETQQKNRQQALHGVTYAQAGSAVAMHPH